MDTISTVSQFQHFHYGSSHAISTNYNFNMRAKRASEKVGYNFNNVTISTFGISECLTISMTYNFNSIVQPDMCLRGGVNCSISPVDQVRNSTRIRILLWTVFSVLRFLLIVQ